VSSRFASATNETASARTTLRLFIACALDFASGFVRAHDGLGTFSWASNSYDGVGRFGGIDVAEETIDVIAKPVKMKLSGVDSGLVATTMTEEYQGRSATLYFGLVNPDTNVLFDTPETLWDGLMDQMSISLGQATGEITLNCEHRLRAEPCIARYTDADQQKRYSGDRFFDVQGKIQGFRGTWGAKGVANDLKGGGHYDFRGRQGYVWVPD